MAVRLRRDLLRCLESDALGRGRPGVTRGAALLDDRRHLGEGDGRPTRRAVGVRRPDPDGDRGQSRRGRDRYPPHGAARMAEVEEEADPGADEHQAHEHEPAVGVPVGEGKVVAEHGQEHGQRQVVVVHRPLLRADRRRRVRLPSSLLRPDEVPVGRDDDEEDVRHHDRSQHGPQLEPHRAVGVEEAQAVGAGRDERDEHRRQHELVADHAAEDVVHDPGGGEQRQRADDRGPLGHVRANEVEVGVDVVEDAEEGETRQPGRVRLPLEPVQRVGQRARRDAELLDEVEAAAVDLPRLARDAFVCILLPLGRRQVVVESDEVERGADPDDAGDDVQPAEDEVEPVDQVRVDGYGHARCQRSRAMATSSDSAVSSSSSRVLSSRSRRTGTISAFGRRLTKTTKRKPKRSS